MTSEPLFQNTFILGRPRVAIFADIIKIVTTVIQAIFKDSKKVKKELEIMFKNAIYTFISWYRKIYWFPVKNADVSRIQGVCHVVYIFFGSSLGKVQQCQVS